MKRKLSLFACIAIFISLQTGCFQLKSLDLKGLDLMRMDEFQSQVQSQELQTEGYVQKVDSFIIVLDSSSSMGTIYEDEVAERYSRFMIAKDIVSRMNNTIPEMEIQGTLQRFGYGFAAKGKLTEAVYGPTAYSRSDLEYALQSIITPGGHSPAGLAIGETSKILGSTEGKSAVIVVSDGEKLNDDPLMKVKTLKNQFGDRTCLYTIWVGSKTESKEFMDKIASEMGCGFSVTADDVATSEGMENFVRKVFLAKDSDGDGVPDEEDECPGTPPGIEVDAVGCAGDSDGDGVTDDIDVCMNTPKGAIVDDRGCWVVKGVKFDYKKWDVKPQFNSNLDNIIDILKNTPDLNIRVEGHTDNIGSEKYNLDLSKKRAESIKAYLVKKGIDESRITSMGHGLSKPIADNVTKEGRALNRRAELIPMK
ncbi:MAG: OmpA family protein [Candidatus Scalindua sp.]|jgi:OOP family OmpA-OmpF porin|nr:OmpA family protein [Candidatus Scalindua sp.]MDV5166600.1 OmpA family protein [Candidatus Scalindua sp.]